MIEDRVQYRHQAVLELNKQTWPLSSGKCSFCLRCLQVLKISNCVVWSVFTLDIIIACQETHFQALCYIAIGYFLISGQCKVFQKYTAMASSLLGFDLPLHVGKLLFSKMLTCLFSGPPPEAERIGDMSNSKHFKSRRELYFTFLRI